MFYHNKTISYVKYQPHFIFFKKNYNMKKDFLFFYCMTNINDFDPKILMINEIAVFNSGSTMYEIISYNEKCNTPYIVFNNITCVFRKSGQNKYFVFCETQENKEMLQNYTKIFDEIRRQIAFITDDDVFILGKDFMRIKIKTSDVLPYNKQINFPVCVEIGYIIHKLHCTIVFMIVKTIRDKN